MNSVSRAYAAWDNKCSQRGAQHLKRKHTRMFGRHKCCAHSPPRTETQTFSRRQCNILTAYCTKFIFFLHVYIVLCAKLCSGMAAMCVCVSVGVTNICSFGSGMRERIEWSNWYLEHIFEVSSPMVATKHNNRTEIKWMCASQCDTFPTSFESNPWVESEQFQFLSFARIDDWLAAQTSSAQIECERSTQQQHDSAETLISILNLMRRSWPRLQRLAHLTNSINNCLR